MIFQNRFLSLYVNLEDKNEVLMIDSKTLKIKNRWKIVGREEATGISMDKVNNILFIGCHNKLMVLMNANNGDIIDKLPIGEGVDATALDEKLKLAFASNRDGTLTIIHEDSPEKFTILENVKTMYGSRTMALDQTTHHVFLAVAKFDKTPAPTKEQAHPRAQITKDSFMILEFGR